jgi:hypothetical protein
MQDVKSQDELTAALFQKFIAPRLRENERASFVAGWKSAKVQLNIALAGIVSGYGALHFYNSYYVFDSVQAACKNDPMLDCAKFYGASAWIVPIFGLSAVIAFSLGIAILLGWRRDIYAITNQRVLTCRIGFLGGFDAFELSSVTSCRSRAGLTINRGGLKMFFYLDPPLAWKAEACLNDSIRLLHP